MTEKTELRRRARALRNNATPPERALWNHLCGAKLGGFKSRRQAAVKPFIADFLCPQKALIVELDGLTHDPAKDGRRDSWLAARGYTTLRFTNQEIGANMDGVLEAIWTKLHELPDRWPHPGLPAAAHPSPEGEGLNKRSLEAPSPSGEGVGGGADPHSFK